MHIPARFSVLWIPVLLCGLGAIFQRWSADNSADTVRDDRDQPIRAIRGFALDPFEEPLPDGALLRIGSTRFRFPYDLQHVQVQRAGQYVIVPKDAGLSMMDGLTGERMSPVPCLPCWPNFSVSPNDRMLVTRSDIYSEPSFAQLWRIDPKSPVPLQPSHYFPLDFEFDVEAISFDSYFFTSDSSDLIVSSSNIIAIFDTTTGQQKNRVESKDFIHEISKSGTRFLASRYGRLEVFIRSMRSGSRTRYYAFRLPSTVGLWPNPNENSFYTWTSPVEPFEVVVGDTRTGNLITSFSIPRTKNSAIEQLTLSPQGKYLSYDFRSDESVWDVDRAEEILRIQPKFSWKSADRAYLKASWFSKDERYFSVCDSKGSERHFELPSGKEVSAAMADSPRPHRGDHHSATHPVNPEGTIRPASEQVAIPTGYARLLMDVSSNGKLFALGDGCGRIDVWLSNGNFVRSLQTKGKPVSAIAFSPDGAQLAVCNRERVLRIWDCRKWQELLELEIPADHKDLHPTQLTFSPDGSRLLISHSGIMALLDLKTKSWLWDVPGTLSLDKGSVPYFSTDGTRILCVDDLSWIDASTGKPREKGFRSGSSRETEFAFVLPVQPYHERANALSKDGRLIACHDSRGNLTIVDSSTGKPRGTFPESPLIEKTGGFLRFSPDGRRLMTCNARGQLHVWEIAGQQLAFTLNYPNGHISDARFGVDGRTIITSNHREVIVWDLKPTRHIADPWQSLGQESPIAEQARRTLLTDPKYAIAYLEPRLNQTPGLSEQEMSLAIAQLESDDFRTRERASAKLVVCGQAALPRLQDARLASSEGKSRLESLVKLISTGPTPQTLRQDRGTEILEQAKRNLKATPANR